MNPDTRAIRIETFIGDKSGRRGVQERVSQDEGVGRAEGKLKNPQILQIIYDQSLTITFPAMQHPCPAITLFTPKLPANPGPLSSSSETCSPCDFIRFFPCDPSEL